MVEHDIREDIAVRTYATMSEVEKLLGYKESNPVNLANYKAIIGDYNFRDKEKCCREKENGNLCGHEHNFGFVIRLNDSSVSIVGNICAKDHFNADSKVRKDIKRYENQKRRLEKLTRLIELLDNKVDNLNTLNSSKGKIKLLRKRVYDFSNLVGSRISKRLQDKANLGNATVEVKVVNYSMRTDEYGDEYRDRRETIARIGAIKGLNVFSDYTFRVIHKQIDEIRSAYSEAENISDDVNASKLEQLTSSMSKLDQVQSGVEKIEKEVDAFFSGDLTLLCYLTDDKSERIRAAKLALEVNGDKVGREKAKNWLIDLDSKIKEMLGAEKIEITD